jgi:hypothetical protein
MEYTFFLEVHGNFSKIDCILGYKTNVNIYMKIEVFSCILLLHNEMQIEINNKRNFQKHPSQRD